MQGRREPNLPARPATLLNQNTEGWDRQRLLAPFLVVFLSFVVLVRNLSFVMICQRRLAFLTKITKRTKITKEKEFVATSTSLLLSRLADREIV